MMMILEILEKSLRRRENGLNVMYCMCVVSWYHVRSHNIPSQWLIKLTELSLFQNQDWVTGPELILKLECDCSWVESNNQEEKYVMTMTLYCVFVCGGGSWLVLTFISSLVMLLGGRERLNFILLISSYRSISFKYIQALCESHMICSTYKLLPLQPVLL